MNLTTSRHSLKQSKVALFGLLFIFFAMLGQTSSAQTYRGGITGNVSDNTGAAISGAAVTIVEDATNATQKAVSTAMEISSSLTFLSALTPSR